MIFEALLWTAQLIAAGIELAFALVLPHEWTTWYRAQIATWGLSGFAAMTGFFHLEALGAYGATMTLAFVSVGAAIVMRTIRAVRDWFP